MSASQAHTERAGTGVILLVLGMVMSGTVGYFVVESGVPVVLVVFWRCVIGAAGLLVVITVRAETRENLRHVLTSRSGWILASSGVLLIANWILIFNAYDTLTIGVATVIFHVEPFILIGLGALFLRERFSRRTLVWAGLGLLGVVLVARPWSEAGSDMHAVWIGIGLTLVAATLYAGSIIVVRSQQLNQDRPPSPLAIVFVQLIAGAIVTSPALALTDVPISPAGWGHLAVLGLVNTALMYLFIYTAYPRLGTATIGILAYVYPAAAVVVDLIAYQTPITTIQLVGFAAIAFAGIAQVTTVKQQTSPATDSPQPERTACSGARDRD